MLVVGCVPRSVSVMLDVVRRIGQRLIFSREQAGTAPGR
jgi:hypothetical protein